MKSIFTLKFDWNSFITNQYYFSKNINTTKGLSSIFKMISQAFSQIEEEVIKLDIYYNHINNQARIARKGHLLKQFNTILKGNSIAQMLQSDKIKFYQTFKESLNPIYEKVKIFPKKVYICGFCKEHFTTSFSYIGHCLIQECPINHNRSTYNYFLQNSSKYAEKKDFQHYLSKELLQIVKNNHKVSAKGISKKFNIIKNSNDLISNHYYCGQCQMNYNKVFYYFVKHCINKCQRPLSNKNSHKIVRIQNNQNTLQFVQDIMNLTLNFNLLTLYKNSFIKIQSNKRYKKRKQQQNEKQFYCGVCKNEFQNSTRLIEHLAFVCKQPNNKISSHFIKRIIINSDQQSLQQEQYQQEQQELQESKTQSRYYVEINPIYASIQDTFESIFFVCGGCGNIFNNCLDLMGHSAVFRCPINHPHSSHLFINQSSKLMNQQECQQCLTLQQKKSFIKQNPHMYSNFKTYYKLEQNGSSQKFYCGNCKITFNKNQKFTWIRHILTKCFCSSLKQNSHILTFQNAEIQIINKEQILAKMKKTIIHHKIKQINPSVIYEVRKNKRNHNSLCFCGKCEGQFQDIYELVYHSLSICDSIHNKQGSHLIMIKIKSTDEKKSIKIINQQTMYKQELQLNAEPIIKPRRSNRNQTNSQIEQNPIIQFVSQQQIQGFQNYKDQIGLEASFLNQQISRLYQNIHFKNIQIAQKYFCGQCQINFNRGQTFIRHVQECKNFKSMKSSHYYLSNKQRSQQIKEKGIKCVKSFKKHPIASEMLNYIPCQNYYCGCGKKLKKSTYKHHMSIHDDIVPYGSSHVILQTLSYSIPQHILFSVKFNVEFNVDYHCPCQPTKKLSRQQFIFHIIKKHRGKSPLFVMQVDN